ncbi:hypothetical protein KGG54_12765 [Klebsiella variicola subsp. variicola]|uniref:hypothetical protein n=1 Tax=Klebsiella pneumoniae complex TaxID=3390273 RepID=UPI000C7B8FE8|nr:MULTISPECIES: hypothetical protein [Klebsiella]PLN08550.1 hypothetical protein CWM83_10760 [Klebsiella pneumoniae]MCB8422149.1 hypothetical protein [Klebsiella variicola subsp. variicola]MCB8442773.1 hypothetical protein [Klebsiella variicola subsp. variicola]MCB8495972.1 hypothetical protein [Klebsiella variicola subsp. variicola]MDH1962651.1 hypothetical protein [Klebsiella quasipneumoniae]
MGIEAIAGLVVVILGVIAGAFGVGHARGTSKAESKAKQQRTEENAAATVAAAERRAEVTKGASDVQQTVSHMPDDYVDRELREKFTRPGSR